MRSGDVQKMKREGGDDCLMELNHGRTDGRTDGQDGQGAAYPGFPAVQYTSEKIAKKHAQKIHVTRDPAI